MDILTCLANTPLPLQLNVLVVMAEYHWVLSVDRVHYGLEFSQARGMQQVTGHVSDYPEQVRAIHRLYRSGLSHDKLHGRVEVSKGAVGWVLCGEILSLVHVSLELPEDEIDVLEAGANHAMHSTPAAVKEDPCPVF